MSVYVDELRHYQKGGVATGEWCHMIADGSAELRDFVRKIGLRDAWVQRPGRADEHYDLTPSMRRRAVAAGAREVSTRELVAVIRERRGKLVTR